MIFPDKLVPFQDSMLAKSVYILKALNEHPMSASELYIVVKDYYDDVSEFVLALDTLYMLNKIILNNKLLQVVEHVNPNKM